MSNSKSTKVFNLYANNYSRSYANTYFDYLPKEIIDIIHEYNADHRPTYNEVLEELVELRDACWMCTTIPSQGRRLYISRKRCLFCNSTCFLYTQENRYEYFINKDISEIYSVRVLLRESVRENRYSRRMQTLMVI